MPVSAKTRPLLFEDEPLCAALPVRNGVRGGLLLVILICLATRLVTWTAAYSGALLRWQIQDHVEPPIAFRQREIKAEAERPGSPLVSDFEEHVGRFPLPGGQHGTPRHFAPLLNWDAPHYRSIVEGGYRYEPKPAGTPFHEAQQNIAFFPLYPLACAALKPLLGTSGAMIFVANVAALASAILLYLYIRRRIDERAALWVVAIVFCWPTACFYSFGYSESLNLLLTVLTMLLADRGRFLLAAVVCGLATATRPTAVTLVPVFLLAYWVGSPAPRVRRAVQLLLLGAIACLGAVAYAGYLDWRFGSPQVYYDNLRAGWIPPMTDAELPRFLRLEHIINGFKYFGRAFRNFPVGLVHLTDPVTWNIPLTLAILFLSLAGIPRVPRRFRPWMWLGPLIFVQRYLVAGWSSFGVESLSRYMMLATPALIVLGVWCEREWKTGPRCALIAALLLLEANWAFRFGLNEWAG